MKLRELFGSQRQKKEIARLLRIKSIIAGLHYQQLALRETSAGIGNDVPHELVISLTSFRKRIDDVHLTIESLFQQSLRADRIVLWLERTGFGPHDIPASLRRLEQRGLTIAFCDEDLGPYTKYFYALQQYPDSLIVTVDDDVLYPPDMLDMLYRAWLREPHYVHCHRAHKISFDKRGELLPYEKWDKNTADSRPSSLILPTGTGGVLYFPGSLHPDALNKALFMQLAPRADDIWLKAMTLKQGVLSKKVDDTRPWKQRFVTRENSQQIALKHENMRGPSGNNIKLQQTFGHYALTDELRRAWRNEQ